MNIQSREYHQLYRRVQLYSFGESNHFRMLQNFVNKIIILNLVCFYTSYVISDLITENKIFYIF